MSQVDEKRFRELVLLLGASGDVDDLGPTKLWKLLYYIDATALREFGEPITNAEYIKYEHGPVPSCGEKLLRKMNKAGVIRTDPEKIGGYTLNKITPLEPADESLFSEDHLSIIRRIAKEKGKKTAVELSKQSHKEPSWRAAGRLDKMSGSLIAYGIEEDPDGL